MLLHTPQNLTHLRGILRDFFQSRYGTDISHIDIDPILLRAAAQVSASAPEGTPLTELNKRVLRVSREMAMAALPPKEDTVEGLLLRRQKDLEAFMPQRPSAPMPQATVPPPIAEQQRTIAVPSPAPPRPPSTADPEVSFFLSSTSRDPRREPGPCRFTVSAAAGRAPHQAFHQVFANNAFVPGTSSAYTEGYANAHGFVLNGQTFGGHVPDAEPGAVHAMCASPALPPPASGLPLDAVRLRVARVMIGMHNRRDVPACVQLGGAGALYVLDRECGGHAVYLPFGAEAADVRVANGRAEVEITLPHQDRPAIPLIEGERVAAVAQVGEGIGLHVPGGVNDVRVGDVVQLAGACVYTLPGGDEDVTRALNVWLGAQLSVTAVRNGGMLIVVDGSGLPQALRDALHAFPHKVTGVLTRPLNQVALICSRRA